MSHNWTASTQAAGSAEAPYIAPTSWPTTAHTDANTSVKIVDRNPTTYRCHCHRTNSPPSGAPPARSARSTRSGAPWPHSPCSRSRCTACWSGRGPVRIGTAPGTIAFKRPRSASRPPAARPWPYRLPLPVPVAFGAALRATASRRVAPCRRAMRRAVPLGKRLHTGDR
jgi:hypothetical protein